MFSDYIFYDGLLKEVKPDKLTVKQMTGNIEQLQYCIGNDYGL